MIQTNVKQKVDFKKVDFTGKTVYVGMDVHRHNWNIAVFVDGIFIRTFQQPPRAEILVQHLREHYPGASYKLAYEAGFCGFGIHRKLREEGMECIVVHAADVPHTHKSTVSKTDKRDSRQIGEALSGGMLKAIHVPDTDLEGDRILVRYRYRLQHDQRRCRTRIKSLLYQCGIVIPREFDTGNWSKKYVQWLQLLSITHPSIQLTLQHMIDQVETIRSKQKEVIKQIRLLFTKPRYQGDFKRLNTIPGIGPIIAISLLTEIGDINRFKTFECFNSFIGFCPSEFSSGDSQRHGRIITRHHKQLRQMIIEAAWVAIRHDPALALCYAQWKKADNGKTNNKAIVKIARKLLNRIFMVLQKQTTYEKGIVQ